jgi:hypothetical protein
MKKFILPFVLLLATETQANITSASLFREMMSTNPATISLRSAASFSLKGQKDKIEIDQDLTGSSLGGGSKYTGEVDINNLRVFYGGKGNGLTSELLFEQGSGGRTDKLTSSTENTSYKTDATVTNINASFGLGKGFGIGITKAKVEDKTAYNITINGTNYSDNTTIDYDLTSFNIGFTYNLGLDFGFFFKKATLDSESNTATQAGSDNNEDRFGLGVGFSSKKFRAEVGFIRNLKEKNYGNGGVYPAMAEFTSEISLGKIRLGYTGRYFMDGFFVFNGIIYDVLAYRGNNENRLENTFNFALGDDSKGHSFSGSLSISTVKSMQTQPILANDTNRYNTETTSKSASITYSYVF